MLRMRSASESFASASRRRDNSRVYVCAKVAHVWEVVKCVYGARAAAARAAPAPARDPLPRADPMPRADPSPPVPPYTYSAVEEDPVEEVEQWAETQFHNSGVLGMPTLSIYIPPPKYSKIRNDEVGGWVSAASAHYVDVDGADWTLPEEAFPLRSAPPPAHHHDHHSHPTQHPDDKDAHAPHSGRSAVGGSGIGGGYGGGGVSPGGSSSPGSGSSSAASACTAPSNLDQNANTFQGLSMEEGLSVRSGEPRSGQVEGAPLVAQALRYHADLGDVQTPAVVCIVLHDHRNELFPYIEEGLQEHWLLGYIEFLQRHKVWNVATEVVRCAWVGSVWSSSQQSTGVAVCCGRCGRRTRPHAPCDRCHPHPHHQHYQPTHMPDLCSVCHTVVRGLYAWCQGCSHGGHLDHMRKWMEQYEVCPAGCGHHCQLG